MNKILIFDAYPSVRELLAEELAAEGYTVVPIGNPNLIPDLIATFDPDLFILAPYLRGRMDWKMFDSAKRKNPKLPILILTEWISEDPHYHQADACLPKSHDTDKLKQKIKEIIEKRLPEKTGSKAALIFCQKATPPESHATP